MLLVMLMALPLIGALVVLITRDKLSKIPFIFTLMVFLLGIFGLKDVFGGMSLTYSLPMVGPLVMTFHADALTAVFVILGTFLWLVVSIYSPKYMEKKGKLDWKFEFCSLFTLFSILGIFLANNLLTMLLFFELMTISSYFLVIYRWDKESIKAGSFYLFFSIVGGLLVALGIAMMGSATDVLPTIGSGMVTPLNTKLFGWSIAIMVLGFGIKAGMVPVHLWLPRAYTASPVPGSVLLAGVITKVGVYGLLRVGELVGWGIDLGNGMSLLSFALVIIGTSTMLLGVLAALIQSDAKRLLAYHSISQMGYIILGLGIALYLGSNGGYGLSGSIYHIINHSLFKSALFLGVGIIYMHTGETDVYKLGGLWRRFPVTAILMLLAVLGITGTPGLNGYASKSLLHHGVSLAAETSALIFWVEKLFLVVGVGTVASFVKLYYLTFLGKPTELEIKDVKTSKLNIAMGLIIIVMVGIGLKPDFLVNSAIIPTAEALGMQNISATFIDFSFWGFKDIFDMIITLIVGAGVCWLGLKSGAFHWHPPVWMTIEGIVMILYVRVSAIVETVLKWYHSLLQSIKRAMINMISGLNINLRKFDESKSSTVLGVNLIGISADVAILILVLGLLIAFYSLTNLGLF